MGIDQHPVGLVCASDHLGGVGIVDPEHADTNIVVYVDEAGQSRYGADLALLADRVENCQVKLQADGVLHRLAATLCARPGTNLLQGPYAPRSNTAELLRPWRSAAALLGGLAAVQSATGATLARVRMGGADDYEAAAHVLSSGANLGVVRRFAHDELSPEQLAFREALFHHATTSEVAGRPVASAAFEYPEYVPAVSGLVNDLLDLYAVDAAVAAVAMDGATLVFARSNERFDCAAALAASIGGGGHAGAAFGKSSDGPPDTLRTVLAALAQHAAPTIQARDLMSAPVKSAKQSDTVSNVVEKLLLYGHNGMPVVVIEDVITSGGSALDAVTAVRAEGGNVIGVLAVLDRQAGGRQRIEAEGLSVVVLAEAGELLDSEEQ